jgi:hypothetical protein
MAARGRYERCDLDVGGLAAGRDMTIRADH